MENNRTEKKATEIINCEKHGSPKNKRSKHQTAETGTLPEQMWTKAIQNIAELSEKHMLMVNDQKGEQLLKGHREGDLANSCSQPMSFRCCLAYIL